MDQDTWLPSPGDSVRVVARWSSQALAEMGRLPGPQKGDEFVVKRALRCEDRAWVNVAGEDGVLHTMKVEPAESEHVTMLDPEAWLQTDWGRKAVERGRQRAHMLLVEAGAFKGEVVEMATRESHGPYQRAVMTHLEDEGTILLISETHRIYTKGATFR